MGHDIGFPMWVMPRVMCRCLVGMGTLKPVELHRRTCSARGSKSESHDICDRTCGGYHVDSNIYIYISISEDLPATLLQLWSK